MAKYSPVTFGGTRGYYDLHKGRRDTKGWAREGGVRVAAYGERGHGFSHVRALSLRAESRCEERVAEKREGHANRRLRACCVPPRLPPARFSSSLGATLAVS